MATQRKAPGKLAARVKQVKTVAGKAKKKVQQEARDFTYAYSDAGLTSSYKESGRIARRAARSANRANPVEYKGETVDLRKKRKAVKQISENLNTSATGRERKKLAKSTYKSLNQRTKTAQNVRKAARKSSGCGNRGGFPGACGVPS
jgi:hypothetical protein